MTREKLCVRAVAREFGNHRKNNVIIYGVSEIEGELIANKVEEVLWQLNEEPFIQECCRLLIDEECYILMYIMDVTIYRYIKSFGLSWHERIMCTILID